MTDKPSTNDYVLPVRPEHLEISDIQRIKSSPGGLVIKPIYYDVTLFLSGKVVQEIIRWAIREGFVLSWGGFTIPNRTKKETYNVTTKKENNAS